MTDDSELLRSYIADRSEAAFAQLVERHLNLVYGAALRRTNGDSHLAEDVTQVVFTALAQEATSLQRHVVIPGWLYVATRHAAANAMRSEKRRKLREQEAYVMQETSPTATTSPVNWDQLRLKLDAVMDELNASDRDAVLLRFFENRPFADVGVALRISEDAARVRVNRALEQLRQLLVKRGISSTGAALAVVLTNEAAAMAPSGLAATIATAVAAFATATDYVTTIQAAKKITTPLTWKITATLAVGTIMGGLLYRTYDLGAQDRQINSLEKLVTDWQRQAGQLRTDRDRFRAQIAQAAAARTATPGDDAYFDDRLRLLLARTGKLKQRMNQHPEQQIPELNYLEPSNWLEIAQQHASLETVRLPRIDGHALSPKKGLNDDKEENGRGNAPAIR